MIYCIRNNIRYSSSFNIFSVVAGLFLWAGHLGAVQFITKAVAFFLAGFSVFAVVFPLTLPIDLWVAYFHRDPVTMVLGGAFIPAFLALLYWIYVQLRSEPVLAARAAAGQSVETPKKALVTGALIPIALVVVFIAMDQSEPAEKAVQLAAAKVGSGYKFHVSALNFGGAGAHARVTAYNEKEIREVEVEW